jgi:hypothetical protein
MNTGTPGKPQPPHLFLRQSEAMILIGLNYLSKFFDKIGLKHMKLLFFCVSKVIKYS